MDLKEVALRRLENQQLVQPRFSTEAALVGHMGAMQAQDFAMAKWAIGLRLPGCTDTDIESALNSGTLIRTHLLRPTWHIVAGADLRWILELTAPHVRASMRARHTELEISHTVAAKSRRLLEKAIAERGPLTREEIAREFSRAGIATHDNRLSHLLLTAELDGLVCSGPIKGIRPSYALVDARVPGHNTLNREESLALLATRYFTSHGPATMRDFAWWSGLPAKDVRRAVGMVRSGLTSALIGSEEYWFVASRSKARPADVVRLLPAYDEFLIAYRNRSASLPVSWEKDVVSSNGIFRPVVVHNGRVIGMWRRISTKGAVTLEVSMVHASAASLNRSIAARASAYAAFLGKELTLAYMQ
jgi:hypothetical protein